MPPEVTSLLDAINAGIPTEEPEQELTEVEDAEEAETPEGGEAEAPEGEEVEALEGDEEAEGEEAADGEAAAAALAAKKPVKDPDPINDPLPKGTLQSTSERFKHVVDKLKEQTSARETIEKEHSELIGHITGAGMGAQEFNIMLEYASNVNGNTYEGLTKAKAILLRELAGVSKALGEPQHGQDPLTGHDDLVKEVNAKTLTPERAMEIAAQRNRAAAQTRLGQAGDQRVQTAQQAKAEQNAGTAAITALGKELATKDGTAEYRRKAQLVVDMLAEVMPKIPPNQWASTFRAAYAKVPAARAAPAAGGKSGAKPQPQPLRGNKIPAGGGGLAKQPKNLREAIDGAFSS